MAGDINRPLSAGQLASAGASVKFVPPGTALASSGRIADETGDRTKDFAAAVASAAPSTKTTAPTFVPPANPQDPTQPGGALYKSPVAGADIKAPNLLEGQKPVQFAGNDVGAYGNGLSGKPAPYTGTYTRTDWHSPGFFDGPVGANAMIGDTEEYHLGPRFLGDTDTAQFVENPGPARQFVKGGGSGSTPSSEIVPAPAGSTPPGRQVVLPDQNNSSNNLDTNVALPKFDWQQPGLNTSVNLPKFDWSKPAPQSNSSAGFGDSSVAAFNGKPSGFDVAASGSANPKDDEENKGVAAANQ
jgi:hypothetical protein